MDIISVAANPPALMKSKPEAKGEGKGLDSSVDVKFADVLSTKSEAPVKSKPELPTDKRTSKFKSAPPSVKGEMKSETEQSVAEDEAASEETDELKPGPELGLKRFQLGQKNDRPKTEREKVILKFMDSFESEFRIPPQEMVAAMAQLSQGQLVRSPEETADAVIQQLGLDEDQAGAAKEAYLGLLMQLHQLDQKNPTSPMAPPNNLALLKPQVRQRFEMGQDRKAQRDLSIQSLSNRFWMKAPESKNIENKLMTADQAIAVPTGQIQKDETPLALALSEVESNMENPSFMGLPERATNMADIDTAKLSQFIEANPDIKISPEDLKKIAQQISHQKSIRDPAMHGESMMIQQGIPSEAQEATKLEVKGKPEFMVNRLGQPKIQEVSQQEAGFRNQSGQFEQQGFQNSLKHSEGKLGSAKGKEGKINVEDLNFQQISANIHPDSAAPKAGDLSKLGGPLPVATATRSESFAPDANVRQIMNQAQYLIKNGGGEMNVQMSPEGLGSVQLKVLVSNGKVNVQMMTESKEAKNAIESSIADLKSSLSAQKLSVEHVKVDVVSGANADNNSQTNNNNNFNGNAQRDSTKQFWNQFQESFGNRGQRDGFFDVNTKGYASRKERDPLQPIEGPTVARLKEGKGSGLNLVA